MRTEYLANLHDGIGERLININTGFLNDPAFRAAGWSANPAELKRIYSPPIPTAVTSEYFQAPPQSTGLKGAGFDEEEEEEGIATAARSNDTIGPVLLAKRRRRREQLEEVDSSDLSDESDEDTEALNRPAGQIKFAKMPVRDRAGSSPIRSASQREGPEVFVSSPSQPSEQPRQRAGSLGATLKPETRPRRDTTTSSEISSENDLDPSVFKRRNIRPAKIGGSLAGQIKEDDEAEEEGVDFQGDDAGSDSDSSLASAFSETLGSNSLLGNHTGPLQGSIFTSMPAQQPQSPPSASPRKGKLSSATLQDLPPARPISMIQPVSALAMAIRARNKKPTNPIERFAVLSGNADSSPLYIKIYVPFSPSTKKPLEVLLKKSTDEGEQITVAEAIGFSLWKYGEAALQPALTKEKLNVNRWTLRIVEDGDVDYDFPPLVRTRPILDFTSNNNRPARVRAREKPWDEFALVEADQTQLRENESLTPIFSEQAAAAEEDVAGNDMPPPQQPVRPTQAPRTATFRQNPITDPFYINPGFRKETTAADAPTAPVSHATPRTGAPKTINIHFTSNDLNTSLLKIEATTDTYIAEVFDQACKRLNLDKALFVLKVTGTTIVAPSDRTVEALGPDHSSLDLVRRRFVGDGTFGLSGSPGSTSPNAPLLLTSTGASKITGSRRTGHSTHPLAQSSDLVGLGLGGLGLGVTTSSTGYKRYNVIRKQPMSFTPSHQRVLVLDGEFMHVMPGDMHTGKEKLFDPVQGKTTSVHFSSVVGCKVNRKHPKTFRVVVFKERESKRYDFEAGTAAEAAEIVQGIKRGIEPYRDMTAG